MTSLAVCLQIGRCSLRKGKQDVARQSLASVDPCGRLRRRFPCRQLALRAGRNHGLHLALERVAVSPGPWLTTGSVLHLGRVSAATSGPCRGLVPFIEWGRGMRTPLP